MKNVLHYILLICFLLISILSFSQPQKDSVLTSTRFLFPQFTDGKVILKDGVVASAKLNYDTFTDQMQFMGANNVVMNISEPEKVINVVILNRTFSYLKNYFVEDISIGTVTLSMRLHQQQIAEKNGAYGGSSPATSIQSISSLYQGDGTVNKLSSNETVSYNRTLTFYITVNGKTKIVFNQNDFLKCFPSKKDVIKQEIDKENCKFSSVESVKKIVDWMNKNGIKD
jgi:hypothetical protein